jgi:hypothetical protein
VYRGDQWKDSLIAGSRNTGRALPVCGRRVLLSCLWVPDCSRTNILFIRKYYYVGR